VKLIKMKVFVMNGQAFVEFVATVVEFVGLF